MAQYTDHIGRTVMQLHAPQSIVSLVPSLSELLYTLQLDKEVTGITRFCVHPPHWLHEKTRIGGTKQLHIEKIHALIPDLVIAGKEENVQQQVEEIATFSPVWVSDINNLPQAIKAIEEIGILCNRQQQATQLLHTIQQAFASLPPHEALIPAAYLIWKDPWMTVGGDTFISDMMAKCGLRNIFHAGRRYPTLTIEDLQQSNAAVIILSSEPYPFTQRHVTELQQLLPGKTIVTADGEMFSWYGSRLALAPAYFRRFLSSLPRP